jgi:hypothetical protein
VGDSIYGYKLPLATEKFHLLRDKIIYLSGSNHKTIHGGFISSTVIQVVANQTRVHVVH